KCLNRQTKLACSWGFEHATSSGPSHNYDVLVAVPPQDSESAQRVPAACSADAGFNLQWNTFAMKKVERPTPVLVASLDHGFDRLSNAAVGFDSCIPQIIEPAQDIVMPKRREREAKPPLVDDFAGPKRAKHSPLEQIVFSPLAGPSNRCSFAPCL